MGGSLHYWESSGILQQRPSPTTPETTNQPWGRGVEPAGSSHVGPSPSIVSTTTRRRTTTARHSFPTTAHTLLSSLWLKHEPASILGSSSSSRSASRCWCGGCGWLRLALLVGIQGLFFKAKDGQSRIPNPQGCLGRSIGVHNRVSTLVIQETSRTLNGTAGQINTCALSLQ